MTKVTIIGAAGRMGRHLVAGILNDPATELLAAVEHEGSDFIGADAGQLAGLTPAGIEITADLKSAVASADVAIDFALTDSTLAHVEIALAENTPVVIGTTGHNDEQKVSIRKIAERLPLLMAPNMSVGVNLMWRLLAEAARVLGDDYDVEIVEAHHRMKVDAPSGTAMRTAEVLADALGRDLSRDAVYHREGVIGARTQKEIGIQTLRGGDIVGDHTTYFAGIGERLEITHRASSRDTFAHGAIRAAKWLVGKTPGLYDMQDVLGFK